MKPSEIALNLFKRSKTYDHINSEYNMKHLAKQNRVGKEASKIISLAETLWNNWEEAQKVSKERGVPCIYHGSTSPVGKKVIKKAREALEVKFPDAIVIAYSSAAFGIGNIEKYILETYIDKRGNEKIRFPAEFKRYSLDDPKVIVPLIYHADTDYEEKWNNGEAGKDRQSIQSWINQFGYSLYPFQYVSLIAPDVN